MSIKAPSPPILTLISRRLRLSLLVLITLSALINDHTQAQVVSENQVKAAFIYNFAKFIVWPEKNKENFTICYVGKDPTVEAMQTLSNKSLNDLSVKVANLSTLNDTSTCHILYVAQTTNNAQEQKASTLGLKPILTVSSKPNFIEQGGMIGFVTAGARVQFEINVSAVHNAQLKMSASLLNLARRLTKDS